MMKKSHTKLILAAAAFLIPLSNHAAEEVATEGASVGKWTMDWEAAKELAAEKNLPMLLNFTGSDWCGWCKLMDEAVFAKAPWKSYAADNVVLVTLDFPQDKSIVPEKYTEQNEELRERFRIQGFPTYVILDSNGETQLGQLGAGRDVTPEMFIEQFKDQTRFSEANQKAYIEANPDKAEAYQKAIADFREVQSDFKAWLETGPQKTEENDKKFAEFQSRMEASAEALQAFDE